MTDQILAQYPWIAIAFLFAAFAVGALAVAAFSPSRMEADVLRRQLMDAIDAVEDGFVVFDADDRIVTCNEPFRAQFGAVGKTIRPGDSYSDVVMRIARSGMVPGIEGREQEFVDQLVAKRHSELGLTKTFQTHDKRWIRQRDKLTEAGNIVGTRTDVTKLKEHEQNLKAALEQAKAGEKAKTEFLAAMSHEIRTPMNGILGMADLLRDTPLGDEQARMVDTIHGSAEALMEILNDILDHSKLAAGKMTLAAEPFDLCQTLSQAARLFRDTAAAKGLTFDMAGDLANPCPVVGDDGRLRQIVLNLLGNAVKFTGTGGITLSLRTAAQGNNMDIAIEVADTGVGIPADRIDSVFRSFEQADTGTARRFGGTGLGLSISRQLARHMGGDLSVKSEEGVGSRFTLTLALPIARKDQTSAAQGQTTDTPPDLRERTILVAEDNRTNQILIRKFLAPTGARIVMADDGLCAVEAAAAEAPDLILMDLSMPGCSGIEAAGKIRRAEAEKGAGHCPIVALTANAFVEDRQACRDAGMDGFLTKPLRRAVLYSELRSHLEPLLTANAAPLQDVS